MHQQRPSSVIVDVEGGLSRGKDDVERLQETLRGLLFQGCECILVNLSQVSYIDSVLLGAILQGYVSAMRVGATVKLLHASGRVKELLAVTKLDRVLETVESQDPR